MSAKDCDDHGDRRRKLFRRLCAGLLVFNLILLVIVLLVWAILRPHKPQFVLQDVTIYNLNASVPNFLTTSIGVTISSRNPNDRIGVYYDRVGVFATYNNQQITLRYQIPPSYQGHKEVDIWSPVLSGNSVPVAPYNSFALNQEQAGGALLLMIKIDGRVRWKVGTFTSGRYHIYVKCPAYISYGSKNNGIVVGGNAVKYQMVQKCSVSI
ncbi:NDR1/HIN1-like protein 1 [Punica granatum]|uniref:Late embryogenesis abundant protein LEA-2 subgroup domain-containing protein n=2 Tax=Punica granatum TaxID=22663 RepID=A0A218X2T6_PUNGR|nr:NDR1/HIN1-like protein 1 [Punica granatum]OWM79039.1 hypothetical protein CDL15_Pgr003210 [Punica granatum]PKI37543.1 hypothetical protein CRG98_042056 [Punica granatum]